MPRPTLRLVCLAVLVTTAMLLPLGTGGTAVTAQSESGGLRALARQAVEADSARADAAVTALRARGPAGLAALTREHAAAIGALRDAPTLPSSPTDERLRSAVDRVSGQRDGHASGLFFYTDLPAALAEARRRHVPVLSFRMLGRLEEELSCANSRYFRTMVYSDPSVSSVLSARFVLHVSTERPAPRITIDMGDGRTMVRTITGNSVHYVLDGEGRVLDALPGLYAPPQFIEALTASERIVSSCGTQHGTAFGECVAQAHRQALAQLESRWNTLRTSFGQLPTWTVLNTRTPAPFVGPGAPSARDAMAITMSKIAVEAPLLDAFAQRPTPQPVDGINWPQLVRLGEFSLSARSLALVRLKTGQADVSGVARELARSGMADGLRNEFIMHHRIHSWFTTSADVTDFTVMNTRVYSELFLTPASDPWLGLRAPDVWDAIEELH